MKIKMHNKVVVVVVTNLHLLKLTSEYDLKCYEDKFISVCFIDKYIAINLWVYIELHSQLINKFTVDRISLNKINPTEQEEMSLFPMALVLFMLRRLVSQNHFILFNFNSRYLYKGNH